MDKLRELSDIVCSAYRKLFYLDGAGGGVNLRDVLSTHHNLAAEILNEWSFVLNSFTNVLRVVFMNKCFVIRIYRLTISEQCACSDLAIINITAFQSIALKVI
jgi:hypothetical protein